MIIGKITDYIIRSVQSIHTQGSKFKVNNLEDLCNEGRAVQIRSTYSKTGRINSLWLQPYVLEFDKNIQDNDCVVKFKCPAPLLLDNETDGFNYIGTLTGDCAWRKLPNRGQLALYQNHRNSGTKTLALWEDGILELHGEKGKIPKEGRVIAAFENPFELPDWNNEFSDYPIDNDNLAQMQQLIIQSLMNQSKTPTNYKPVNVDPLTTTP